MEKSAFPRYCGVIYKCFSHSLSPENYLQVSESGWYENFREYGLDGYVTIHAVWDHKGNKVFAYGEGEDQPELDREQIKQALLTTIPWEKRK